MKGRKGGRERVEGRGGEGRSEVSRMKGKEETVRRGEERHKRVGREGE